MIKLFKNKKGESLVELLVSVVLLSVISMVFLKAVTSLVLMSSKTEDRMNASYLAGRCMEFLTANEGIPINDLTNAVMSNTDMNATVLSPSSPYRFKLLDTAYPEIYAVVLIDYKYYADQGNLSRAVVTVYSYNDDSELAYMENVIYWI